MGQKRPPPRIPERGDKTMLQSTLKSRTLLWLGTALACGTLIISPIRAEAQGYQRALSPAARQTLGAMLAGVPRYEQQLILNAIWALGPRAEMQLAQVRATPPAVGAVIRQQVAQILQVLPAQYHQTFINGLFEVSPEDVQFKDYVASNILQRNRADVDMAARIRGYDDRMRVQQNGAFQYRQDLNLQQAQGTGGALSPFTEYYDPNSGRRVEGYTAPRGASAYLCPGYNTPLYSSQTLLGCAVLYPSP